MAPGPVLQDVTFHLQETLMGGTMSVQWMKLLADKGLGVV